MKTTSLFAPLLVVTLVFVLVCGVVLLTVRAGAMATASSVEILRLQMRVVRLQDKLLLYSQQNLERQLEELDTLAQRAAESSVTGSVVDEPNGARPAVAEPGADSGSPEAESRSSGSLAATTVR